MGRPSPCTSGRCRFFVEGAIAAAPQRQVWCASSPVLAGDVSPGVAAARLQRRSGPAGCYRTCSTGASLPGPHCAWLHRRAVGCSASGGAPAFDWLPSKARTHPYSPALLHRRHLDRASSETFPGRVIKHSILGSPPSQFRLEMFGPFRITSPLSGGLLW